MRVDGIQIGGTPGNTNTFNKVTADKQLPSFKETIGTFLNDVNDSQKVASDAQAKLISGEVTDVHQVMIKSEEANTAFNMLMELRNKAMDGYQELMRVKL
jgi:flagellar hook-basal body complex protein FliE